jgi:putative sterol carrier protein
MGHFKDEQEFRKVFEHIFVLMDQHATVGKKLADARAPHKFQIADYGLEFHVTYAEDGKPATGRFLRWQWGPAEWEPMITLTMNADVANRFFQGKESIATAVMLGRVKLKGPMSKILELAPVTRPIHPVYRQWLEEQGYDHLLA